MFKKTGILTVLLFVFSIFLVSGGEALFSAEKKKAAAKPAVNADAADIKKASELTGVSVSQISKYGLTADQVLQIYSAAAVSGSSFEVVFENSEEGTKLASFYKKYSVSTFAQTTATAKYNKLKSQLGRKEGEKQKYEGVDKRAVGDVLAKKTGLSSSAIVDYGFGSGLPLNDIITACAISAKSGNSLSTIIEKRKQDGDFTSIYASLSNASNKKAQVDALISSISGEVNEAAKSKDAKKPGAANISEDMRAEAEKIADSTGTSKSGILDAMKKGSNTGDIVKAIATARKVGGSFYSIIEMVQESGWSKVNSHYGTGSTAAQNEINKIIADINSKVKPPPPPIEKKELVNGK